MLAEPTATWKLLGEVLAGAAPPESLSVLLVTAHPDDETVGAGALLARLPRSIVVSCTDGAPRNPRFRSPRAPRSRDDYARVRHEELRRAMERAGVPWDRLRFVGVCDQELIEEVEEAVGRIAETIRELEPDLVLTHPYEGGHPDHDACALCVRLAAPGVPVGEMPYYQAAGGVPSHGRFLRRENEGPRLVKDLSDGERELKREMLACFATQREVLAPFSNPVREHFRAAPPYDFREPPHAGVLGYERAGFPVTGRRWRERAAEAIRRLGDERAAR